VSGVACVGGARVGDVEDDWLDEVPPGRWIRLLISLGLGPPLGIPGVRPDKPVASERGGPPVARGAPWIAGGGLVVTFCGFSAGFLTSLAGSDVDWSGSAAAGDAATRSVATTRPASFWLFIVSPSRDRVCL
jgi:hypothetical protein